MSTNLLPKVTISPAVGRMAEGASPGYATFTVTLSAASDQTVTVDYFTDDSRAREGEDYERTLGTLTFAPGETVKTFNVALLDDDIYEGDEIFRVEIENPVNAVLSLDGGVIKGHEALFTIENDDLSLLPLLSLSPTNGRMSEGDKGTSYVDFVVTLSEASDQTVTVQYSTDDSRAKQGSDYIQTQGILTFAPGELVQTFQVPVIGDTEYEPDEIFSVELSNPENAALDLSGSVIKAFEALFTIENDDISDLPTVAISPATNRMSEGNSGQTMANFTVTLSEISDEVVTVDYSTDDSAAKAGTDYVQTVGQLVFQPGETIKQISVPVLGDEEYEADEIFRVEISNPVNAVLSFEGSVIRGHESLFVIENDDYTGPLVSIATADGVISEGSASVSFVFTLSTASDQVVSFDYFTQDSTAKAGEDYVATSGTLVFQPGETTKTVEVEILDDGNVEGDEVFSIEIANPVNLAMDVDGNLIKGSDGIFNIHSDDQAGEGPQVSFAVTGGSIREGAVTVKTSFTASLSEASDETVSFDYATSNGTAVAGVDYVATAGTLVFAPGETEKTFEVDILGDSLSEDVETFSFKVSNAENVAQDTSGNPMVSSSVFSIIDDDNPTFTEPRTPDEVQVNVIEPDSGAVRNYFLLSMDKVATQDISLWYETIGGTATAGSDYITASGWVTIQAGQSSASVGVLVLGDTVYEGNETIHLKVTDPLNQWLPDGVSLIAQHTIVENDVLGG